MNRHTVRSATTTVGAIWGQENVLRVPSQGTCHAGTIQKYRLAQVAPLHQAMKLIAKKQTPTGVRPVAQVMVAARIPIPMVIAAQTHACRLYQWA